MYYRTAIVENTQVQYFDSLISNCTRVFSVMMIVLGFHDTSTFVGHFVSSPREREKRDRIVEEMKEMGQGRNENE